MSAIALLTFLCKTERSCLETDLNFLRYLTGLLHYDSPATTPPSPYPTLCISYAYTSSLHLPLIV